MHHKLNHVFFFFSCMATNCPSHCWAGTCIWPCFNAHSSTSTHLCRILTACRASTGAFGHIHIPQWVKYSRDPCVWSDSSLSWGCDEDVEWMCLMCGPCCTCVGAERYCVWTEPEETAIKSWQRYAMHSKHRARIGCLAWHQGGSRPVNRGLETTPPSTESAHPAGNSNTGDWSPLPTRWVV